MGLYDNFHDLIDPKYHNKMFPKPKLDIWTLEKNYHSKGTKIEREFKKNGKVLSAIVGVVAFDLYTKLYILKWQKENTDTERKTIIQDTG